MRTPQLFTLLVFLAVASCQNKKETFEEPDVESLRAEVKPTEVLTAIAQQKDFELRVNASGILSAAQEVQVTFQTGGYLQELNIKNGQRVTAGQVLAQLENSKEVLALERAKASYASSKVNYDNDSISFGSSLTQVIRDNLRAKNGLVNAEIAIKEAQLNLDNTILEAPISGIVTALEQQKGNLVNSDALCKIYNPNSLVLTAKVLESDYAHLKTGLKADIYPLAFRDKVFSSTLVEIDPSVDENGMVSLKLKIDNPQGLLPGMNANAVVRVPQNENIIVPREALVMKSGRSVIFTLEDGLAKWKYVETGMDNGVEIEVKDGLKDGDIVIVSNNMQLAHDARVKQVSNSIESNN
ncbi:RND family efflux transporter MFP subunit [Roseivirga pacifica]|uniref:RND family efflux transporter, MFP subunit n=1 Tax=Roseivirga pacifica TaxID=1267423 RepID=A0A1I0RK05_9BACT|nr:efflux RND transporter periplasmic adaptor subunit [Roseivirga pacifica]RKQ49797.1 RND family efflux transporter MFP subunit [Roseivirga pacifica]SEW41389.1 RND family efflux transporter, MFP subunit [Roseivirga pacifica]